MPVLTTAPSPPHRWTPKPPPPVHEHAVPVGFDGVQRVPARERKGVAEQSRKIMLNGMEVHRLALQMASCMQVLTTAPSPPHRCIGSRFRWGWRATRRSSRRPTMRLGARALLDKSR